MKNKVSYPSCLEAVVAVVELVEDSSSSEASVVVAVATWEMWHRWATVFRQSPLGLEPSVGCPAGWWEDILVVAVVGCWPSFPCAVEPS